MGAGKSKAKRKSTARNTPKKPENIVPEVTAQPAFKQATLTKAQWAMYRDMRLAERCILTPDDELWGIAIPSVN